MSQIAQQTNRRTIHTKQGANHAQLANELCSAAHEIPNNGRRIMPI